MITIKRHQAQAIRLTLTALAPLLQDIETAAEAEQTHIAGEQIAPFLRDNRDLYGLAAQAL